MANITVPIVVDGIELIAKTIQKIIDETEFKETVSEEYKQGFYDLGNSVLATLEQLSKGGADNG